MHLCTDLYQLIKLYEKAMTHTHTSVYRRQLVEEKLPILDKIEITEDGKKSSLFRTVLKSFNVRYEYNNVVIEAEQNVDTVRKITEKFFSLDE